MSNTDPIKNPGVNSADREEKAAPASFKTLAVLPIYTVKSGKRHENNSIPLFHIQFCVMHIQYK